MPLRCGPVGGCVKSYQNIPAQLSIVLSFTGGTVRACMVIWWLLLAPRTQVAASAEANSLVCCVE